MGTDAGLVAFLVTLVPFFHGMNRHLDHCYLEKEPPVLHGALLFDFSIFFLEAGFLFAAAWSVRSTECGATYHNSHNSLLSGEGAEPDGTRTRIRGNADTLEVSS